MPLAMEPHGGPSLLAMLQDAWEAAKAPGKAYNEGMTQDQMIKAGGDFALNLTGGGMAVPKPLGVMGMSGGRGFAKPAIIHKPEINVKKLGDQLEINETRGENIIKYALGRFYLGKPTDHYTSAAMSFGPKDSNVFNYGNPIGWNQGLSRLNGVKDSLYTMLPKLNPDSFGFTAGSPVLNPLYDRAAAKLAKDFGGKMETPNDEFLRAYTINFPNRPPEGTDPALNELLHKFFRPKGGF
jgi:hypothetical protein